MRLNRRCFGQILLSPLTVGAILFVLSGQLHAEILVRHVGPEEKVDIRKFYFIDLLTLALKKSSERFGPFKMQQHPQSIGQSRAFLHLKDRRYLDVVWSMTSRERETIARPIRIPLMKGMMGYRVLIVHRQKQQGFGAICRLDQLKKFIAVQGDDWPDTQILRRNGLRVADSNNYLMLMSHIDSGRFDYFPRTALEAWKELETVEHDNLTVDQHLLIRYPAAIYFFVHQNNRQLAERIEYGLRQAMNDGSFDELFINHPSHINAFKSLNIQKRRVLELDNPLLPEDTPLHKKKYWMTVEKLEEIGRQLNRELTVNNTATP